MVVGLEGVAERDSCGVVNAHTARASLGESVTFVDGVHGGCGKVAGVHLKVGAVEGEDLWEEDVGQHGFWGFGERVAKNKDPAFGGVCVEIDVVSHAWGPHVPCFVHEGREVGPDGKDGGVEVGGRVVVDSVEVDSAGVCPVVSARDAVGVDHGDQSPDVVLAGEDSTGVVRNEKAEQPVHHV